MSPVGPGDEPLEALDSPAARHLDRRGPKRPRIRARSWCGFGHREGGPHVTSGERPEIEHPLIGIGHVGEQVQIAFVGRGAVHRQRTEQRNAGFLEDRGPLDHAQAVPAIFLWHLWGENIGVASGLLPSESPLVVLSRDAAQVVLDRDHDITHEVSRRDHESLRPRAVVEVHGSSYRRIAIRTNDDSPI
jgi:hypothetical protein